MPQPIKNTAAARIIRAGDEGGASAGMAQFARELQEATQGLKKFDQATDRTTRAVFGGALKAAKGAAKFSGAGFVANTVAKVGRQTVRAAGFDLASFVATQGVGAALNPQGLGFSMGKALARSPTLAKALDLDLTLLPAERAGQRTLGITGAMARLGAAPEEIAPIREALMKQFGAEEMRAAKEARAVEILERSSGAEKAAVGAYERTKGLMSLEKLFESNFPGLTAAMNRLATVMEQFSGGNGGR